MNELFDDMVNTIDTMPVCEVCGLLATSEWKSYDDEDTYYTYRCEDHPVHDDRFNEVLL